MDFLIRFGGRKLDGTLFYEVGQEGKFQKGRFHVFFDVPYIQGESNEDLWGRVGDHFLANLGIAPIE